MTNGRTSFIAGFDIWWIAMERAEVAKWEWEVWNEPDIFYWHGTEDEYFKLYDYTVAAVRRALPGARVGGPASTGPASERAAKFLRDFLEHCANGQNYATGKKGVPLDFISFHAKGKATSVDGHVELDIGSEPARHRSGIRNHREVSHAARIAGRSQRIRSGELCSVRCNLASAEHLSSDFAICQLRGRASERNDSSGSASPHQLGRLDRVGFHFSRAAHLCRASCFHDEWRRSTAVECLPTVWANEGRTRLRGQYWSARSQ